MITIFSAPKKFTNPHINIIQRNAIRSWRELGSEVEVILIGEEDGLAEVAESTGIVHLPDVARNEWGTPLISSIFALAREASQNPIMAYVNADIMLMPDFITVAKQVHDQSQAYLIVGQRWDLDITQPLDFSDQWESRLSGTVREKGKLHRPSGSDYFIFPKAQYLDLPDFAVGRAGWDNWMIYKALKNKWQVIDATQSLMVVHQEHDYSHLPGGVPHYDLEETRINAALGGGYANMFMTLDSNYEFVDSAIRPAKWTRNRILRRLERWFRPDNDKDHGLRWRISRRFRRMRRGLV